MKLLLTCMFVLFVLLGCGGGDPEDNKTELTTTVQPVDCRADPVRCQ